MIKSNILQIGALSCVSVLLGGCPVSDSSSPPCGPEGPPIKPYEFAVNSAKTTVYQAPTDANEVEAIPDNEEAIDALDYTIEVRVLEVDEQPEESSLGSSFNVTFSLFEHAHACSREQPLTAEVLANFDIVSDSDFSSEYPAGSSLSELFEVEYYSTYSYEEGLTEFYGMDVTSFIGEFPITPQLLQLSLRESPSLSKEHNFTVTIEHVNEFPLDTVRFY